MYTKCFRRDNFDKLTEDIDKKDINWPSMCPYYSVCIRIHPPVAPFSCSYTGIV